MGAFQGLARDNAQKILPDPPSKEIPLFPRCTPYATEKCVTLTYMTIADTPSTIDPAWANFTIDFIRRKNNIPN